MYNRQQGAKLNLPAKKNKKTFPKPVDFLSLCYYNKKCPQEKEIKKMNCISCPGSSAG